MTMIRRAATNKIKDLFTQFPVVTVTGPRQSGKSTLVRNLFNDLPYVSLEDPDSRLMAKEDPRGFLNNIRSGAILDEVQYVPELFSYLQGIVDDQGKPGQFVLSGSQNFLLMESITQSLAGRTAICHLLPLSKAELADAGLLQGGPDTWMHKGWYPRLHVNNILPEDFFASYVQTYVERDVRLLSNIGNLSLFIKFLGMCAARIGKELNISSLANDCGIAVNTAKSWLSILETGFVIYLLRPYHRNFNKRIIKSPKLYFYDTGLAAYLLNIATEEQLQTHYLRGGFFENMVIIDILKWYANAGKRAPLYFWKDKTGNEIDLVVEAAGNPLAIEVKSGQTMNKAYLDNFKYWKK